MIGKNTVQDVNSFDGLDEYCIKKSICKGPFTPVISSTWTIAWTCLHSLLCICCTAEIHCSRVKIVLEIVKTGAQPNQNSSSWTTSRCECVHLASNYIQPILAIYCGNSSGLGSGSTNRSGLLADSLCDKYRIPFIWLISNWKGVGLSNMYGKNAGDIRWLIGIVKHQQTCKWIQILWFVHIMKQKPQPRNLKFWARETKKCILN